MNRRKQGIIFILVVGLLAYFILFFFYPSSGINYDTSKKIIEDVRFFLLHIPYLEFICSKLINHYSFLAILFFIAGVLVGKNKLGTVFIFISISIFVYLFFIQIDSLLFKKMNINKSGFLTLYPMFFSFLYFFQKKEKELRLLIFIFLILSILHSIVAFHTVISGIFLSMALGSLIGLLTKKFTKFVY